MNEVRTNLDNFKRDIIYLRAIKAILLASILFYSLGTGNKFARKGVNIWTTTITEKLSERTAGKFTVKVL